MDIPGLIDLVYRTNQYPIILVSYVIIGLAVSSPWLAIGLATAYRLMVHVLIVTPIASTFGNPLPPLTLPAALLGAIVVTLAAWYAGTFLHRIHVDAPPSRTNRRAKPG